MKSNIVNEKFLKLRRDINAILESYTSDDSLVDNYMDVETSIPRRLESQKKRLVSLREIIETALDSKPVEQALQLFFLLISMAKEIEPLEGKTQLEIRDLDSENTLGMGIWGAQYEYKARKEPSVSYQFLTREYKIEKDTSTKQFIKFYLTTFPASSGYSNLPISIIIHPALRSLLHKDRDKIDSSERISLSNSLQVINYFEKIVISENNIITFFASKPNSDSILEYLFGCITHVFKHKNLEQLFKISYTQAINNRCLSNLLSLSKIDRTLAKSEGIAPYLTRINIDDLKLPQKHEIFLKDNKLFTQSPLIEIMKTLDTNVHFLLSQGYSPDVLNSHVIFQLLRRYYNPIRDLTDEKIKRKEYNNLVDILIHNFKPDLEFNFFPVLQEIFLYADLEKIRVLSNFFKSQRHTSDEIRDFMDKRLSVEMQNRIFETLKYYFPTVIAKIIQDYLPLLFEQMCASMGNIYKQHRKLRNYQINLFLVHVPLQKQGSSDCGYWALFNALEMFKEISPSYPLQWFNSPLGSSEESKLLKYQEKFDEFKSKVREYLKLTENADLNAWDLELVLKQAFSNNKSSFSYFQDLSQYSAQLQLGDETPPYTIINTSHASEQKIDKSYLFGGSSYLSLRIAITFYILSLSIKEPRLHCLFIGTQGHWYTEFLTMGPASSEGIESFFILDSADTNKEIINTINLQILDIIKNPLLFATNVAEQTLELAVKELEFLADQNPNPETNEKIYQYCQVVKQFFSVFAHCREIKNFGWALAQTQQIALKFKNLSSNFDNLVEEIKMTQTHLNMFSPPKQQLTGNSPKHKQASCTLSYYVR